MGRGLERRHILTTYQLGELGARAVYQHSTPENSWKARDKFTKWFDGEGECPE